MVALAGTFVFTGGMEQLLERVGAISTLRNMRYWSTTDKSWRPLAFDAAALSGPDPKTRRRDFSGTELKTGAQFHYWIDDRRSGSVVYRMQVMLRTPERVVLASENLSPVRLLAITLFPPGALQTVDFLERRGPGVWGLYSLTRIDERASGLSEGHEASSINRAVAFYRHLAGIPTDQEPPGAP